jgi:REP element-mobilizing transposase RayT
MLPSRVDDPGALSESSVSQYVHKSHNVSALLYHLVCPTKYRRSVLTNQVDLALRDICLGIAERYEIVFLEIGADRNHVHFLVQSVPAYSPTQIVRTIKSITARELFRRMPGLRKALWGSAFWSSGYFVNTVGRHASETVIRRYVKNHQGTVVATDTTEDAIGYEQIHQQQLSLFEDGWNTDP